MASWMVHLRVADRLLDECGWLDQTAFVVGNLGPDCGEPNADSTQFTPPKRVTHWQTERTKHDGAAFWAEYVEGCADPARLAFYLGYWAHLLTDERWVERIARPAKAQHAAEYDADFAGYIRRLKQDWYDLDRLFLREHPSFRAYRLLEAVDRFPNAGLLPYFSETAIERRVQAIAAFYREPCGELDRPYPYLSQKAMDTFVEQCGREIAAALHKEGPLFSCGRQAAVQ